jgi:hypothetical protein
MIFPLILATTKRFASYESVFISIRNAFTASFKTNRRDKKGLKKKTSSIGSCFVARNEIAGAQ